MHLPVQPSAGEHPIHRTHPTRLVELTADLACFGVDLRALDFLRWLVNNHLHPEWDIPDTPTPVKHVC